MIRGFLFGLMSIAWGVAFSFAGEMEAERERPPDISEEDMKIIRHLETLEMMEMAEQLQLLEEMDILTEEEPDETDN
jgi:hypothetical protein